MALATLVINGSMNVSVSVGDIVYYTPIVNTYDWETSPGSTNTVYDSGNTDSGVSNVIQLGPIQSITPNGSQFIIEVDVPEGVEVPALNDFLLFSKNNQFEISSILGYYSLVRLQNNSKEKAELFSVAMDITESSK